MKNLDSLNSLARRSLALLGCTLAFASCSRDDSIGNNIKRDAAPDLDAPSPDQASLPDQAWQGPASPDASVAPADAWSCNLPSRVDDQGVTQWSWRLQWWAAEGELAATCASYGAGAKMVMEVDVPTNATPNSTLPSCTTDEVVSGSTRACAIAGAFRFVADCSAKELVFELPSESTFHGYFHVEGPAVTKAMRYLLGQNVECSRQVFTRTGVSALATSDAGLDAILGPSDGSTCAFDGGGLPGSYADCVTAGGKVISATATTPTFCVETYLENFGNRSDYTRCRAVGGYTGMFDVFGCDGPIGGGYCQVYYPQNACPTVAKPADYWWPTPSCNDFSPPTSPSDASPDGPICAFDGGGVLPVSYEACVAAGGKVVAATSLAPTFCYLGYEQSSSDYPRFQQCRMLGGTIIAWDGDAASGNRCDVFYPQGSCPTVSRPAGFNGL